LTFAEQPDLSLKVKSAVRQLASRKFREPPWSFYPDSLKSNAAPRLLPTNRWKSISLYGGLSVEEQQKVLNPSQGNKVILSTNVAETSLTVQGVTAVIDSGLTRQSRVSSWSGLQSLVTIPPARPLPPKGPGAPDACRKGCACALYTQYDFAHRGAAFDLPELLRADLSARCWI